MPRVTIGEGEIAYEESGSGHPLLFVSGLNGTGRSWAPQVPFFSRHFRVITYDQRGTGSSDRTQRSFSVDGMAADVIALLDALGLERVHLVGQSTGGAIGQTLAVLHPERLSRMAIYATWTWCDPWFRRLFEARRQMYQQAGPDLHGRFHPLWLYPPDYVNAHDAEIEEELRRAAVNPPPSEVSIGRIDAITAFDRRADLARITTPTLVMAARDDYITPAYHAEALARAIPGAQLELMESGGHSLSKTRPDAFNARVLRFLQEGGGRSAEAAPPT